MTPEEKLFAAVHAYGDVYYDDSHETLEMEVAKATLLEAVDEYSGRRAIVSEQLALKTRALADAEAQLSVYDKLVHGLKLMEAKAAVCDAYLAWMDAAEFDMRPQEALDASVEALRKLEAGES